MTMSTGTSRDMQGAVCASKIIGESVANREGEDLGKIHELILDARAGRVAYAVLSFGGFMGMGTKLFAMPWQAFQLSETDEKLILNVDRKTLEGAPGFDQEAAWPDFADRKWGGDIHRHYGYEPYWQV